MEVPPPSYSEATSAKPWKFIAGYLLTRDLCAAVLTCRDWNEALLPALWGNPTSHFTGCNDSIYATLTRFRRILPHVRPYVRALVHTLDLPRASADYDYSPRSEWLRDIIYYLPSLQSLVTYGLPFLDHASILSLSQSTSSSADTWYNKSLGANLRLLKVSNCRNATPLSLSNVLEVLPLLVYLDFSFTPAARDRTVLRKLSSLQLLRVLNLRKTSLTDEDLETMANCIGRNLKCLDVRENRLTSKATDSLLQMMLNDSPQYPPSYQSSSQHRQDQMDMLRSESLEKQVYESLTSASPLHWILDDIYESGLTHLRIAKNAFSLAAVILLLRNDRLSVLDAGELAEPDPQRHTDASLPPSISADKWLINISFLRIPYTLMTGASTESRNKVLHATDLRRLKSLVFTGVPLKAPDDRVSQSIIEFLRECAQESRIAQTQARLDYTLPPTRSNRADAWKQHAKQLFALHDITLEMSQTLAASTLSHMKAEGWSFQGGPRSMTEDADSESLWKAAASDFSFFGSEEQGPQPDEYISLAEQRSLHDTVAEIASFRKTCKARYDRARALGEEFPKIEGYWDGLVKIVRNS